MGCARAANLGIGLWVAGATWIDERVVTYLVAYGLYIAGITIASRAEDMEPPPTRRLTLFLSLLPQLLALGGLVSLATPLTSGAVFALPLALLVYSVSRAMLAGTREAAKTHVLRCLLNIFLIHLCCVWNKGLGIVPILACAAASYFALGLLSKKE